MHHYSFEFKKECVELYRQRKWPENPEWIRDPEDFHDMIRRWNRIAANKGIEALQPKEKHRIWSLEEKYDLVSKVLAGRSIQSVALEAGIHSGLLHRWVSNYRFFGYNGLKDERKRSNAGVKTMKKMNVHNPRKRVETEHEELLRLRAENEYMRAEIELIKKEIALREERQAAQLKAKKQRSSKNSGKKDTN